MEIISDMTRQYKSVEEELNNNINNLERREDDNAQEINQLKEQKKELDQGISEEKARG